MGKTLGLLGAAIAPPAAACEVVDLGVRASSSVAKTIVLATD